MGKLTTGTGSTQHYVRAGSYCYTLLYIGIEEHPSMQQKNWAEFFTGVNAPNVINRDSDLSNQGMTQNA